MLPKKVQIDLLSLKMAETFMSFGISKEFLIILNQEQIRNIGEEPEEELLLVNSIKS